MSAFAKSPVSTTLINKAPGMFYICSNGEPNTITFVSEGCLRITGYSQQEISLNSKINFRDLIHIDDRARLLQKYKVKPGEKFELAEEYRIICADGNIKWVNEIARGIYTKTNDLDYIEGYVYDIDCEKNESLAINSLSAYQRAIDTASIVSITDTHGRIIYANEKFCEISKFSKEELIGSNHRIINSGFHNADFFMDLWHTIKTGKIWHGEIKNKAKDGSYYWVDTTISPIFNNEGRIIQYLSIRSVITKRKKLEQEQEQLNSELTHKYNELMQFNYIVSHNLRAPVANMISLTKLLSEETEMLDMNAKALINYISKSALTLDEVIKDLTQVLSARSPINEKIEKVNLRDIIKSVENNLEDQIRESGTKFLIDIDENANFFKSIKSYVQSIFYNLISNAIKYSKEDTLPVIAITAKKIEADLMITITDNGIGLNLDKIGTHLFGLYKKFNFLKEGRGLGLHMVKTQVESLSGKIDVRSEEGKGTTFIIRIPV